MVYIVPLIVAVARWPHAKPFTLPLAGAIGLYWYVYTAVPFAGGDQNGMIRALIGFFCYSAAAGGMWELLRRSPDSAGDAATRSAKGSHADDAPQP